MERHLPLTVGKVSWKGCKSKGAGLAPQWDETGNLIAPAKLKETSANMSKKPGTEEDLWTDPPQPLVNDNVAFFCYSGKCPRLHLWLPNDAPYNGIPSGMNAATKALLETADGYDTVSRILGSCTSTNMQVDQYCTEEFNRCQLVSWVYVFFRDHHLWNARYDSEQDCVDFKSELVKYVYLTLRYTCGRLAKWANSQGHRTIRPP